MVNVIFAEQIFIDDLIQSREIDKGVVLSEDQIVSPGYLYVDGNFLPPKENGTASLVTETDRCLVCGNETNDQIEMREHMDANEGHFYVPAIL